MKIPSYKFALVTALEGRYTWEGKPKPVSVHGARYVNYSYKRTSTYRLDLDPCFFIPKVGVRRRHSVRVQLTALFEKISNNFFAGTEGESLVLMWTDASHWLGDRSVVTALEVWDGNPGEPEGLWSIVKAIGPWED